MLTLTLLSYPYVLLPIRAALWRMDPSLEEASRGLGYSSVTTFLRVTLSLLRPGIAAGGLLVALYTLSDFGAVSCCGTRPSLPPSLSSTRRPWTARRERHFPWPWEF